MKLLAKATVGLVQHFAAVSLAKSSELVSCSK